MIVKIFLAYVWLFAGGQPLGAVHINEVFTDFSSCQKALDTEVPSILAMIEKESDSKPVLVPKCVELDVPTEVKTAD